jgi:hypothetical protein
LRPGGEGGSRALRAELGRVKYPNPVRFERSGDGWRDGVMVWTPPDGIYVPKWRC